MKTCVLPARRRKSPRMDDPRPVTLKGSAVGMLRFGVLPLASTPASSETEQRAAGQKFRRYGSRPFLLLLRAGAGDSSLASLTRRCPASFAPCSRRLVQHRPARCGHTPASSAPIARRPASGGRSSRTARRGGREPQDPGHMRSLALRRLASANAYWPILK